MALEQIVAAKRAEIARRKQARPLEAFARDLEPGTGRFAKALRQARCSFVLECKKASPSEGLLRADFDAGQIAREYGELADAISVVTDGPFFHGHLQDVRRVREAADRPVLCKDFILEDYQVYEARQYGADAVLLMRSILEVEDLERLQRLTWQLGMDALVEVHTAQELRDALTCGARILGINNRDLSSFEVRLETTESLAPLVPKDVLLICESGIRDRSDLLRLRPLVDGFLIGSSLMRRCDLGDAARDLLFGRVKVCGLTREEDALAARRAGATWGGLIFAPESPRCVLADRAAMIRNSAALRWAGVFVNEAPGTVRKLAEDLNLDAVQLHGEEDPHFVRNLKQALPERCEVWKAWPAAGQTPEVEATGADRLVLDQRDARRRGGTGVAFDWSLVDGFADRERLIVAGGLNPRNAERASRLGVFALDVNSGVESAPGRKSPELLIAFFQALRGRGRS